LDETGVIGPEKTGNKIALWPMRARHSCIVYNMRMVCNN
jgi:hypothetical protein